MVTEQLVGPWGCEEGDPFRHESHESKGRIQKIVLQNEGGFKSLDLKYTPLCLSDGATKVTIVTSHEKKPNIIKDSNFSEGIGVYWRRNIDRCLAEVVSSPRRPECGEGNYVIVSRRKECWDSIEQDITGEVCVGGLYDVSAYVSIKGGNGDNFEMCATVKIENMNNTLSFLHIGRVFVRNLQWVKLNCSFFMNTMFKRAVFYLEGPCPSVDLLIGHVSICPVTKQFMIKLDQSEYLTGITGFSRTIQQGASDVISSLSFNSNLKKYGPFGPEEGTFFSFSTTDGEIIGFYGTFDRYLNSIGCHVKPIGSTMDVVKSEGHSMLQSNGNSLKELMLPTCEWPLNPGPWGGNNGKPFDDGFNIRIKQILLTRTGKFISSIQFEYERHGEVIWSVRRGSLGPEKEISRIKFKSPEEYLVYLTGFWNVIDGDEMNHAITSLTFFSNKEKYGPVGEEAGKFFSSPAAAGQIRGFFGRSSTYLNAIGVHMEYINSFPREDVTTPLALPALTPTSAGHDAVEHNSGDNSDCSTPVVAYRRKNKSFKNYIL